MTAEGTVPVREFIGEAGVAALSRTGTTFEPLPGVPFRARVTVVPLDRTRITSLEITAHRATTGRDGAMSADVVLFHFVLSGRLAGRQDETATQPTSNSIRFVRADAPWRYVSRQPAHVVAWWVDLNDLRPDVGSALHYATTIDFRDDAIAQGAAAVIRSILVNPPTPNSLAARRIEEVLISQVEAAVLSADATRLDPVQADRRLFTELRRLLADDLGRSSVRLDDLAAELDTSPAVLARVLSAQGLTARRLLIEMRLEELAALLRDPSVDGSLTDIVARAGFAGLAQASRAFSAQHDVTMRRYRALMRGEPTPHSGSARDAG